MFDLMLITNNQEVAQFAVDSGVNRIFLDTEINGKRERQGHLDTVISEHSLSDLKMLRKVTGHFDILVRINPLYQGTKEEVETAIQLGADIIMFPMFHTAEEVKAISRMIDGRVKLIPLVETKSAIDNIEDIAKVEGVSEVHIGLNDLHLDMGLSFMFELLVNGVIEKAAEKLNNAGMPFGIGGIAKLGEGKLPADMILSEHVRLGSKSAILSRAFHNNSKTLEEFQQQANLKSEVSKIYDEVKRLQKESLETLLGTREEMKQVIHQIAGK
ncbi:aldolase/citrate lyase family protein [Vibrio brasiliensis]|uniref:aldolase/citrate lyase family protein n=1 Tax=Vibrio brasiliensis TaxID=170652 RepID=UPI001EFC7A74|nr:aldolase/citrate lyase family protein [Vibrio brasiliensis]MCG9650462.1 aldolase/citrate lyase family protein [Vibrio brasiliensis]